MAERRDLALRSHRLFVSNLEVAGVSLASVPVIDRYSPAPTAAERLAVERLAQQLCREHREWDDDEPYRPMLPTTLAAAGSLHLDDVSEIPLLDRTSDILYMQDRCRLRAGSGDLIASCSPRVAGYEEYCRDRLGLGDVEWLFPNPGPHPLRIARACWDDRQVRRSLVRKLRAGEFEYVHPHMGALCVWQFAALLRQSSRRPVRVLAPPPMLCRWVNDKIAFAETVSRLFGRQLLPRSAAAWNLSGLAQVVQQFAATCRTIGLKLPNSAGGEANLVIPASRFCDRELAVIHEALRSLAPRLGWDGTSQILVDCWETHVLCSPSAQLWIPPPADGAPIVEGLFEQWIEGEEGEFVGAVSARLPVAIEQQLVHHCWLLARLYQILGYVGRCSFDMILVGDTLSDCRLEFVECNGRWGGTSLPMTLVHRLARGAQDVSFAVRECVVDGLERVEFSAWVAGLSDALWDAGTRQGSLVLFNPGAMRSQSAIHVVAMAASPQAAQRLMQRDVPGRLRQSVTAGL